MIYLNKNGKKRAALNDAVPYFFQACFELISPQGQEIGLKVEQDKAVDNPNASMDGTILCNRCNSTRR